MHGDCGGAFAVQPGQPSICCYCGDEWFDIEFPGDKVEIEAELLKQPGRRMYSPVRSWSPGQTLKDLQVRTEKALELKAQGVRNIRALSIGTTRIWAAGEVLTAGNMNTFISAILGDLAGRDGRIDLEAAARVKDGTSHTTQPFLDLTQDYVGLPQRSGDPAAAVGRMYYNTALAALGSRRGGLCRPVASAPDRELHCAPHQNL